MSQNQEMPTLQAYLPNLTSTMLKLLNVQVPSFLPEPIADLANPFLTQGVDRIVLIVLDNFGLFEITYYKPEFLISKSNALVLLSTKNPYTLGMYHQLMFGGLDYEPNGFHLLKYLAQCGKTSVFLGRERDVKRYDGGTTSLVQKTDMETWVSAAKVLNRYDFSVLHFLDFEDLYRTKQKTGAQTPEELIDKLIKRTDKWLLSMHKQLRKKSLLLILGNHGRYKIDLNYSGKIGQWRAASVPLLLAMYKDKDQ
jgi:hypothetical protein